MNFVADEGVDRLIVKLDALTLLRAVRYTNALLQQNVLNAL